MIVLAACNQGFPFTSTELVSTRSPSPSLEATTTQKPPTQALLTQALTTQTLPNRTPSPSLQPASTLEVNPEDLRGLVIDFWHTWDGRAGDTVKELVDTFNVNNEWSILVVPAYQGTYDNLFPKVTRALEEGDIPNVVVGFLHQAQTWDKAGQVVDLNPYVNDPNWGFGRQEQDDFYPVFWEYDLSDGKRLGVPAQRSGQLLLYNTTWAQQLGFNAPPSTPDQFKEQACAAAQANLADAEAGNNGTGGWMISAEYPAMLSWIYAFGGDILRPEQKPANDRAYNFDTPKVAEAFTFLREMLDEGCAWLSEGKSPEQEFAQRRALFASSSLAGLPDQVEAFQRAGSRDEWTVLPFPSPEQTPAFTVYGPGFEVLKTNPEQQLASWLFLKWMLEPSNQARLVEATGAFPLRISAQENLEEYASRHPQWEAAVEALPYAHPEPVLPSWGVVRWALGDAGTQLFRAYFSIEQVGELLEFLDQTAHELHLGPEESGVLNTATSSPTPSSTPTKTLTPTRTPTPTRTLWPSVTNPPAISSTITLTPPPSSTP